MSQAAQVATSIASPISRSHLDPRITHFTTVIQSAVLWCGVILLLASCETTGTTPGSATYNIFFSPVDHVEQLLAEGKVFDASEVYEGQREFFNEESKSHTAVVGNLWTQLKKSVTPEIEAATDEINESEWPVKPDRWVQTRQRISDAASVISRIESNLIVREGRFPFLHLKRLKDALGRIEEKIRTDAPERFNEYAVTTAKNFFDVYPVALEESSFLCRDCNTENPGKFIEILKQHVEGASTDELLHVHQTYEGRLSETNKLDLGRQFFLRTLQQKKNLDNSDPQDLGNIVSAVMATRESGFPLKDVPGVKLGLIEITSKTLLKQGQIDFPAAIDVDLPFHAEKAELDAAFTGEQVHSADHLIIMDVALAQAERRVIGIVKVPSRVLTGYRTDPNPEYNMAQNSVNNARLVVQQATMNKMSVDSQWCQGLACLGKLVGQIAAGSKVKKSQTLLQDTMSTLNQTPMTVETPMFADYKFDKATVKATKTMTVNYYIVDQRAKKYFKSTYDVVEKKTFEVAYRVNDRDPNKDEHLRVHDTEEDVVEWEEAPSTVKLSQLIQNYLGNEQLTRDLPDFLVLRNEMLKDKNKALAKFNVDQFKTQPVADPRLDHVVVVYTGAGSMGTGFFVKPDVVLTNWHVVDEHKFVELKMHDGQETFGKVIAKDVRLDLALIKVQNRGLPVKFFAHRQLGLGSTVEALGHPNRLEFSVTRGVVSAVRKQPSIHLAGAGKKVLYIQTDAPINRGNSGGPLFLGRFVIGVNTFKKPDFTMTGGQVVNIGEGLNFAVHFAEVVKFLKQYLPSYTEESS